MITFAGQTYKQLIAFNLRSIELVENMSEGGAMRVATNFNIGTREERQNNPKNAYVEFRIGRDKATVIITSLIGEEHQVELTMPEHANDVTVLLRCAIELEIPFDVEYPDQGTDPKELTYKHEGDKSGLYRYVKPEDFDVVKDGLINALELIDDNCTDNYRVFPAHMEDVYVEQQQKGCCGSYDKELMCPSGNIYFIGFNYGH